MLLTSWRAIPSGAVAFILFLAWLWYWPSSDDVFLSRLHTDVRALERDPRADFYSYLKVDQDASDVQIRRAWQAMYRRLADQRTTKATFTIFGGVVKVLRTPRLKSRYDTLLRAEGLLIEDIVARRRASAKYH